MMFQVIAIILMLLVASPAMSDEESNGANATAESNPVTEPSGARDEQDNETLSTELRGIDSLGVMPKVVATPYQGGTRRVELESTVFRREQPFVYNYAAQRDPFRALIADEKKEGEIQTDLLIVEGAVLTGIVWAEGHYLAMIRDKDSRTFFLREGDPVYSGSVTSVTESHVMFEISTFGDYQRVTLKVNG